MLLALTWSFKGEDTILDINIKNKKVNISMAKNVTFKNYIKNVRFLRILVKGEGGELSIRRFSFERELIISLKDLLCKTIFCMVFQCGKK